VEIVSYSELSELAEQAVYRSGHLNSFDWLPGKATPPDRKNGESRFEQPLVERVYLNPLAPAPSQAPSRNLQATKKQAYLFGFTVGPEAPPATDASRSF